MMSIQSLPGALPLPIVADAALRSIPILCGAWLAATLWRRASAASRHLVWFCALALTLVVPVVRRALPVWNVTILRAASSTPLADTRISTQLDASGAARETHPTGSGHQPYLDVRARDADALLDTRAVSSRVVFPSSFRPPGSSGGDARLAIEGVLAVLWVVGALAVLVRWLAGVFARRRLVAGAARRLSGGWRETLAGLDARGTRLSHIVVYESPAAVVPMTWGILVPKVMVPSAPEWPSGFRRAAFLHELAHIERRDVVSLTVARLACAAFWFNPLVWIAAHALRRECELACDDRVLRSGARASDYARQLLDVAAAAGFEAAAAGLTMARRATLPARLRAILDATRSRTRATPAAAGGVAFAALVLVPPVATFTPVRTEAAATVAPMSLGDVTRLPVAPDREARGASVLGAEEPSARTPMPQGDSVTGVVDAGVASVPTQSVALTRPLDGLAAVESGAMPAAAGRIVIRRGAFPCLEPQARGSTSSSMSSTSEDGRRRSWRAHWTAGDCRFEFDAEGEITFNDDATDVRSISRGGSLELEVRSGDSARRLRITPGSGADVEREYWLNGRRAGYDRDAADWFAQALVALDRRTAFAVEQRLPVLLRRSGVNGALEEIATMPSDFARRIYYTRLFTIQPLSTAQLRQALADVGSGFTSDYERAELLVAASKLDAFDGPAQLEFGHAAGGITSDYERRRALSALLARDRLAPSVVRALLEAAQGMKSDYELAELLIAVAHRYAVDEATRPLYVRALRTIQSDYERRRVMASVFATEDLPREVKQDLLEVANGIQSDYDRAELLIGMVSKGPLEPSNYDPFFAALRGITSDYEHHRVLSALLKGPKPDPALVVAVLRSARSIRSDYECASLLVEIAGVVTMDDQLRRLYEDTADTIGSQYEYGRAMAAVRRKN